MLALGMMICIASHCQPSLGGKKSEVLKIIRDDPELTFDKEAVTSDGTPCIFAHSNSATFVWYFKNDVNYYLQIMVDEGSLSNYTKYFDVNFKKDGEDRWTDCLHGPCLYYLLQEVKGKYVISVSWNKLI